MYYFRYEVLDGLPDGLRRAFLVGMASLLVLGGVLVLIQFLIEAHEGKRRQRELDEKYGRSTELDIFRWDARDDPPWWRELGLRHWQGWLANTAAFALVALPPLYLFTITDELEMLFLGIALDIAVCISGLIAWVEISLHRERRNQRGGE